MIKSAHKENTQSWWDERFESSEIKHLYSKEPSPFLMEHLSFIPEGGTILDIGCGEGRNAVALAKKGFQVTAIDFSEVALSRAKNLAEEAGVEVDWRKADLDFFIPDLLSFDAAICIEFMPPKTLQKNVVRGLKQGGDLLVEAYLMEAAKENQALEVFECLKPGEALSTFLGTSSGLQIKYYSELSPERKVFLVAKKAELF